MKTSIMFHPTILFAVAFHDLILSATANSFSSSTAAITSVASVTSTSYATPTIASSYGGIDVVTNTITLTYFCNATAVSSSVTTRDTSRPPVSGNFTTFTLTTVEPTTVDQFTTVEPTTVDQFTTIETFPTGHSSFYSPRPVTTWTSAPHSHSAASTVNFTSVTRSSSRAGHNATFGGTSSAFISTSSVPATSTSSANFTTTIWEPSGTTSIIFDGTTTCFTPGGAPTSSVVVTVTSFIGDCAPTSAGFVNTTTAALPSGTASSGSNGTSEALNAGSSNNGALINVGGVGAAAGIFTGAVAVFLL